jgi:hypothetical protein
MVSFPSSPHPETMTIIPLFALFFSAWRQTTIKFNALINPFGDIIFLISPVFVIMLSRFSSIMLMSKDGVKLLLIEY